MSTYTYASIHVYLEIQIIQALLLCYHVYAYRCAHFDRSICPCVHMQVYVSAYMSMPTPMYMSHLHVDVNVYIYSCGHTTQHTSKATIRGNKPRIWTIIGPTGTARRSGSRACAAVEL